MPRLAATKEIGVLMALAFSAAGLFIGPAAHAAEMVPAKPTGCSSAYTYDSADTPRGAAAHCSSGTGQFRARATCRAKGSGKYYAYGSWKLPGTFSTSYADCTSKEGGTAVGHKVQTR